VEEAIAIRANLGDAMGYIEEVLGTLEDALLVSNSDDNCKLAVFARIGTLDYEQAMCLAYTLVMTSLDRSKVLEGLRPHNRGWKSTTPADTPRRSDDRFGLNWANFLRVALDPQLEYLLTTPCVGEEPE